MKRQRERGKPPSPHREEEEEEDHRWVPDCSIQKKWAETKAQSHPLLQDSTHHPPN